MQVRSPSGASQAGSYSSNSSTPQGARERVRGAGREGGREREGSSGGTASLFSEAAILGGTASHFLEAAILPGAYGFPRHVAGQWSQVWVVVILRFA